MTRIRALDGLRGVAVLLVVIGHISGTAAPYSANVGVTLFFVLSGFLITSLLIREKEKFGYIAFAAFYARRALRLYPALLLVIALVPLLLFLARDPRLAGYPVRAAISATYVADFAQATGFDMDYFNHMWSLAVEEQFYLLWPALIVGIIAILGAKRPSRSALFLVVVGLAAAGVAWRVVASFVFDPDRVYYAVDTNAYILLLGCALALVPDAVRLRIPGWISVSLLLAVVAASVVIRPIDGAIRNWVVVGTSLVAVVILSGAPRAERFLGWRILVFFGTISYGLYLWHVVLLSVEWDGSEAVGALRVLLVATAVVIAFLSFQFVELPIQRRFRGRFERSTSPPAPGALAVSTADRSSTRGSSARQVGTFGEAATDVEPA